jgi:hypothetical protein
MKRLLRPQIIVMGSIAVALLAWSTLASVAGSRTASHVVVGTAKALQSENSHEPVPASEPTASAPRQAEPEVENEADEAAEEQNEQAEDADEPNEVEEVNPPPPAPPAPAPPATTTSKTFNLIGGTATFSCTGNVISLVSAVPNKGFSVETEREDGGTEIKVKFESETHESEIRVTCVAGQVQAREIQEQSH